MLTERFTSDNNKGKTFTPLTPSLSNLLDENRCVVDSSPQA